MSVPTEPTNLTLEGPRRWLNVPAERPLDAFLLKLHHEGLDIWQAMRLHDQGIPEQELRTPPRWERIARLVSREIEDLHWRSAERERTGDTASADDYAARAAAWDRQLGDGFGELPPAVQAKRLRDRKNEAIKRGQLPDTMRRQPFAKGYAGPPLDHSPLEHQHWEIDQVAAQAHAAVDRAHLAPSKDGRRRAKSAPGRSPTSAHENRVGREARDGSRAAWLSQTVKRVTENVRGSRGASPQDTLAVLSTGGGEPESLIPEKS